MTNRKAGDEEERVHYSNAHRYQLLKLLQEQTEIPKPVAQELSLSLEHQQEISTVIQLVMDRPALSVSERLEELEGLLLHPSPGLGAIYEQLDEMKGFALREIAARCFARGLELGRTERPDEPASEES